VSTQSQNQQFQDPFVAVVVLLTKTLILTQIDPHRTISSGKVDIGAFRTYPEDYTPPDAEPSEYQPIPLSKIEDFGVHASKYYSLSVSHFKSSLDTKLLDLLWNKYWVATLSQSPLLLVLSLTPPPNIRMRNSLRDRWATWRIKSNA
jgi:COP9 signalosome complex subunit 5